MTVPETAGAAEVEPEAADPKAATPPAKRSSESSSSSADTAGRQHHAQGAGGSNSTPSPERLKQEPKDGGGVMESPPKGEPPRKRGSRPRLGAAGGSAHEGEQGGDPFGASKLLDTPRTVEACQRLGFLLSDLEAKAFDTFWIPSGDKAAALVKQKLRFEHRERRRQERLSMVLRERERLIEEKESAKGETGELSEAARGG